MNKNRLISFTKWLISSSILIIICSLLPFSASASNDDHEIQIDTGTEPYIVVSLGDSYASGEGVEPFYYQDLPYEEKYLEDDWLGHRSEKSWAGRLQMPYLDGPLKDYKDSVWYFKAFSGARTYHLKDEVKTYDYHKLVSTDGIYQKYETRPLAAQLSVFNTLEKGSVRYVTVSIGGNDMGFVDVLEKAFKGHCNYLKYGEMVDTVEKNWVEFYEQEDGIREKIRQAYRDIQYYAGDQAEIIVVGYPGLLAKGGAEATYNNPRPGAKDGVIDKYTFFDEWQCKYIDYNVYKFDKALEKLVKECQREMNIHYVSVLGAFYGHEAYSEDPYLNEIELGSNEQDIDQRAKMSSYSMHPNEKGLEVYADLVQRKINWIEGEKEKYKEEFKKYNIRKNAAGDNEISLIVGEQINLESYAHSIKVTIGDHISWGSSDNTICSIDQNGTVTALSLGECRIDAEDESGQTIKCIIKVTSATAWVAHGQYLLADRTENAWNGKSPEQYKKSHLTEIALSDVKQIDNELFDALSQKDVTDLYTIDLIFGQNDAGWETAFMKDGRVYITNGSYAFKVAKCSIELDNNIRVYSEDQWIPDPWTANAESLTPNTLFCPSWQEEPDENGFSWSDNPVAIGGPGLYTLVIAQYANASSSEQPGYGIGLILKDEMTGYPYEEILEFVPSEHSFGIVGSFEGSGWGEGPDVEMKPAGDSAWSGEVSLKAGDEFKVRADNSWDYNWGDGNNNFVVDQDGIYVVTIIFSGSYGEVSFSLIDEESLVRTVYEDSGTVTVDFPEGYSETFEYSYRLPKVLVNSKHTEDINREIDDHYLSVVQSFDGGGYYIGKQLTTAYEKSLPFSVIQEDNSGLFKQMIDYDSAVFNDILSVRVTDTNCVSWKKTNWEVSTVYTLNLTDGNRLNGKEVLDLVGMTQQDLLDRLYWEIEQESRALILSIENVDPESDDIPDWLQDEIDVEIRDSLSNNDFDEILDKGIYLNENGHLEVRLMMQLGAASEYTIVVDIDPVATDYQEEASSGMSYVGSWIGDYGSVIVLRTDNSALYCEPENENRPELQAGIECSWDYVNGYPSLFGGALDYDLFMEPNESTGGMRVYANDERWTPEVFYLCRGLSEEEARAGLQYDPSELMFAIGDWSSVETFAKANGMELVAGADRDYYGLIVSEGSGETIVLSIGQATLDDSIYASCDGPCDITLCGVKVGDSVEKLSSGLPRYGAIIEVDYSTDFNGHEFVKILLGVKNGLYYSVEYTYAWSDSEYVIISWYVYQVDPDYVNGSDRMQDTLVSGMHSFTITLPSNWSDHVRFEETPEGNWRVYNTENGTTATDGLIGEIVFSNYQSRQRLVDYCAELNERYGDAFRMLDRNEIPVVYASEWSGGIIYVSMAWGSGHYTAENKDLYMELYSVFYEARNTITVQ